MAIITKTKNKVLLTGGGTAGHVTPNIALLPGLKEEGCQVIYIGGKTGMEKGLIENCNIPYFGISSGKLRRYLDIENVKDIFKVIKGLGDAFKIIKREKPQVIFSKGGYVAVPVVVAGWLKGVPVVIHESDISPGLANKLSIPFAKAVCVTFPETLDRVGQSKAVLTGTPIRKELFKGDKEKGLMLCGFNGGKPVILVMGGSSGSAKINACLRQSLSKLLKIYQVVHICGKDNVDDTLAQEGYKQFAYLTEDLPHIFAAAELVVSRAGANSISEFLALQKPCLLIPLSKNASRGDQILNAASFEKQGFGKVLAEENMNEENLVADIIHMFNNRSAYIEKMSESKQADGVSEVLKVIKKYSNR